MDPDTLKEDPAFAEEMLYAYYLEHLRQESEAVQAGITALEGLLEDLPPYGQDAAMDILFRLLSEQERTAFLAAAHLARSPPPGNWDAVNDRLYD